MQPITLKPEKKSKRMNLVIEPSLMDKIDDIASRSGVSKSQVVRYILASFLRSDYQNLVVENQEMVSEVQS